MKTGHSAGGGPNRHLGLALRAIGASPAAILLIAAAIVGASVGIFGFSGWSLGVPIVLIAAILADGTLRPGSRLFYPTITHGPRNGRQVALSFDDGPDPETTPRVLDVLARHGAHATFFVIGRKLAAQPELARRILAEGHELGNHSWQHSRLQNLRGARFNQEEIEHGAEAIAAAGQNGIPIYRPPVGLKSPHLAHAARRLRLPAMVAWSLRSGDTRDADPERIAQHVLNKIRPGDIILLHDGHDLSGKTRPACPDAVTLILQGLKKRGLEPATVSQLIDLMQHSRLETKSPERTGV